MIRRLRETTLANFVPARTLEQVSWKKTPIPDSGKYDFEKEAEVREMVGTQFNYAESGPTFDPSGQYLCGTCNMRIGKEGSDKGKCTHVSGIISMGTGGCRIYTLGEPIGAEESIPQKVSQQDSLYGERPRAKGFGCYPRCEYGVVAKKPDPDGRKVWCGLWGIHVMGSACCSQHDGPDLIEAPGEKKK